MLDRGSEVPKIFAGTTYAWRVSEEGNGETAEIVD